MAKIARVSFIIDVKELFYPGVEYYGITDATLIEDVGAFKWPQARVRLTLNVTKMTK